MVEYIRFQIQIWKCVLYIFKNIELNVLPNKYLKLSDSFGIVPIGICDLTFGLLFYAEERRLLPI